MNLTVCDVCGATLEAHPLSASFLADNFLPLGRGIQAVVLLSQEPHDLGDWLVTPQGVERVGDPDRLRGEGVPLRRNHQDDCERPRPPKRKRVWTKNGWRTR